MCNVTVEQKIINQVFMHVFACGCAYYKEHSTCTCTCACIVLLQGAQYMYMCMCCTRMCFSVLCLLCSPECILWLHVFVLVCVLVWPQFVHYYTPGYCVVYLIPIRLACVCVLCCVVYVLCVCVCGYVLCVVCITSMSSGLCVVCLYV